MSEVVLRVETGSPKETEALGRALGGLLCVGDIVALVGELGAGKTILTKGIAAGLGVENTDLVTSPTYKVLNQYKGRVQVNHFDAYRLEGPGDFADVGGEDLLSENAVSVIEWAERTGNVLPRRAITVRIQVLSEQRRKFEFHLDSNRAELTQALAAVRSSGEART